MTVPTESIGRTGIKKEERPRTDTGVNLTSTTISIGTSEIEPVWPIEDVEEQEATEGMRRLSLRALESQWDDDESDEDEI